MRFLIALCAAALSWSSPVRANEVIGETIVLGQSAPFTGPSSKQASEFDVGARTYFQAVNESGGVHGRKIELRALDDGYDPSRTAQNTRELVTKSGAVALFGYVGTTTTLAAVPIASAEQVPLFAPSTGAAALRQPFNRYVFNVRASYVDEADHIVEQLGVTGIKHIAVYHQNDAYGKAGLDAVMHAKTKRNLTLGAVASGERDSTDVSAAVAKLLADQPQAVVLVSSYHSCAALIREMKKAGYMGKFISLSYVGGKSLADELGDTGAGMMISEVVPFPWAEASAVQREYAQAMRKAGVPTRSFASMEGFIAAKVLTEGLRRAGRDLSRAKLVGALETLRDWDAGGFRVSFSPENHNGTHFVEMTMLGTGGRFVH